MKEFVKGGLKRAIVVKENIAKRRNILAISSTSMDDIPSSSRSPHYEDLETNVFGSKKIKAKRFSLSDVEKKRLSVGWILDSSDKIGQNDDDFEDPLVRVTRVTETSTSTLQPNSQTSSPGDILFYLPEDQMEGVVVGEATNDKEKETVADSIGASNEEVKKPENEHNDEKQDDQPVCVSNEEFKQPHDIRVVEQQAIVPYIGSGSECKLVEFTLVVSKCELKPGAQLKLPYINIFGSSEPVQEPKKKCATKRKVKGLYPFKTGLLAEVDSNMDTKFNGWFEKGFKPDNKRKMFADDANLLEKPFDFAIDTISHKMWWFQLLYSGECLRSNHIDICFYYMRKEIKYSSKIELKVTTTDSSFDQNLRGFDYGVFLIVFAMFIIHGMTHKIPRDLDIDWYRNKNCVELYHHALKEQLENYESESEGLGRRLKQKKN
ncbi:hypothetical protein PanWU01x14_136560 [Parasponia andersonii]|uniref:Ulp1 protease family, C-terminal catalytic domain containing protein n=1 Tax=Parasponia andersonii TaxID=3476 RepID=A0A2P5CNZ3_PARAD|nr:hypothetical protein PanWU01x14_136560 [Parasponia andersonii]